MNHGLKKLPAQFFRTLSGDEPVRTWLKGLSKEDRQIIGEDVCDVEFSWPIGMPLCRSIKGHKGMWEIRSNLTHGTIARILFYVNHSTMILLHGFIKKTQKTPTKELTLAIKRKKEHEAYD